MHPDANLNAVRSWRCEEAGNIVISNEVKKLDITGGDGVRLKILKMERKYGRKVDGECWTLTMRRALNSA